MSITVNLDWKAFAAIGGSAAVIAFVSKLDKSAAEHVSTHAVDACKEFAVACANIKAGNSLLSDGNAR